MIDRKERHFSDLSRLAFFLDLASPAACPESWKRCQNGGAKEGKQYLYTPWRRLRFIPDDDEDKIFSNRVDQD
jgi:hypothetical protein